MKYYCSLLLTLTTCLFTADIEEEKLVSSFLTRKPIPVEDIQEKKPLNKGYLYLKGGMNPDLFDKGPALAIGAGYRSKIFPSIKGAMDLCVYQQSAKEFAPDVATVAVFMPTLSYQYYFKHSGETSFYLGAGAALAACYPDINTLEPSDADFEDGFVGTSAVFTLGYNPWMHAKLLSSFQLDVFCPLTNANENCERDFNKALITITYLIGY